jgi:hypothetical protein
MAEFTSCRSADHQEECWHICRGDIHVGTADEWQVAMQVLNRHVERAFNPSRKDHHWGRRKLARDE